MKLNKKSQKFSWIEANWLETKFNLFLNIIHKSFILQVWFKNRRAKYRKQLKLNKQQPNVSKQDDENSGEHFSC